MNRLIRKLLEYLRGEPQHLNKLLKRGLKVGKNFKRMGGVIIDPSHCYHITIGDSVTLAPRVHILAHDSSLGLYTGKTRAANVTIGNQVFVGAGSIVTKDIPENSVAVGNPAKVICSLDDYLAKEQMKMCQENTFQGLWWERPDEIAKAVAAADKYGEIFVS